uniref:Uncharacterized protein n=1 Tax=Anguilla anguilla TaxID=7936 RepID=A0A0E9UH44_ANGAN
MAQISHRIGDIYGKEQRSAEMFVQDKDICQPL